MHQFLKLNIFIFGKNHMKFHYNNCNTYSKNEKEEKYINRYIALSGALNFRKIKALQRLIICFRHSFYPIVFLAAETSSHEKVSPQTPQKRSLSAHFVPHFGQFIIILSILTFIYTLNIHFCMFLSRLLFPTLPLLI